MFRCAAQKSIACEDCHTRKFDIGSATQDCTARSMPYRWSVQRGVLAQPTLQRLTENAEPARGFADVAIAVRQHPAHVFPLGAGERGRLARQLYKICTTDVAQYLGRVHRLEQGEMC